MSGKNYIMDSCKPQKNHPKNIILHDLAKSAIFNVTFFLGWCFFGDPNQLQGWLDVGNQPNCNSGKKNMANRP